MRVRLTRNTACGQTPSMSFPLKCSMSPRLLATGALLPLLLAALPAAAQEDPTPDTTLLDQVVVTASRNGGLRSGRR